MITSQKPVKKRSLHYQERQYESQKYSKKFNIDNKMDITAKHQCFVTIKDYKDDFRVNPKYGLLNPTKSELGKVSKHILQQIKTNIKTALNVNQ